MTAPRDDEVGSPTASGRQAGTPSGHVFLTGMIRSGTSLAQVLLTNHPDALVVYQPYFQLYLGVKQEFLAQHGVERMLPLDDGAEGPPDEPARFREWLETHDLAPATRARLLANATSGKGGGLTTADPVSDAGATSDATRFGDLWRALHRDLAHNFGDGRPLLLVGSKEVLCEEFVPYLLGQGVRCVTVVRDPRAVVASASSGRYLQQVGDRYPLLMLVRTWRKSVRYAEVTRRDPAGHAVRYEDLVADPDVSLDELRRALSLPAFPRGLSAGPLLDHAGEPWRGNSSFGDRGGVDARSADRWRSVLPDHVARFVEACTLPELRALGYPVSLDEADAEEVISHFREDLDGVRTSYLEKYRLDDRRRDHEIRRLREPAAAD